MDFAALKRIVDQLVERSVVAREHWEGSQDGSYSHQIYQTTRMSVIRLIPPAKLIAEAIPHAPAPEDFEPWTQGWEFEPTQDAALRLQGLLAVQAELTQALKSEGPTLLAEKLHPWIWDHASALWSDGHRRAALQAAATALFDSHIPAKLNRTRDTKGGKDLMGQAFSDRDPAPGAPRLRFTDTPAGTAEWTSAHEGAMHLGQGCAQAIRNPSTHDLREPSEQEALEMLAALSLVARLVDKAWCSGRCH